MILKINEIIQLSKGKWTSLQIYLKSLNFLILLSLQESVQSLNQELVMLTQVFQVINQSFS